jgi:Tol biopolymer transport system component
MKIRASRLTALAVLITSMSAGTALAQTDPQLTAYDLDGDLIATIGEPDNYSDFVYSPDGSRIAAVAAGTGVPTFRSRILIIDIATGTTDLIAESSARGSLGQPVFSPDGRQLAYLATEMNGASIYTHVIDGNADDRLIYADEDRQIVLGDWSPDGQQLLFAATDPFEQDSHLYLIAAGSGGDPTPLATFDHPVLNPRFSPDGRYLSYFDDQGAVFVTTARPATDSGQETWQLAAGTGSRRRFAAPALGFWDSDDPVFYRIETSHGVRVLATPVDTTGDFEFGDAREITTLPITVVATVATLSPNGERLLIAADPPDRLFVVDADGTEVDTIDVPIRFLNRAFSPDLSRVIAGTTELLADDATWDLYLLDPDAQDASLIGVADSGAQSTMAWSPDGEEVAFVALEGSRYNVYRRPVDQKVEGNGELVYSHAGGPIQLNDWSQDGRYLVFASGRTDPISRLHVIDLESGGDPVVVAEETTAAIGAARFSPDSRYLSYRRGGDEPGLFVTPASPVTNSGNETWQITSSEESSRGFWDSDDPLLYYLEEDRQVMVVPVNTGGAFELGEARQLTTLPEDAAIGSFAVSADGERILFEKATPPEQLFRLPATQIVMYDREGTEIGHIGEPGRYNSVSFSPDGTRIVTAQADPDEPAFGGDTSLWSYDVASGAGTPITELEGGFFGANAVWMADGEHIAYSVNSGMGRGEEGSWIYRMRADGQGEPEPLFQTELGVVSLTLTDVSSDNQYLLFNSFGVVQAVPLTGDDPLARAGIDALRGEYEFASAHLSPDLRLVAYTYNGGETPEVYVSPFDADSGMADNSKRVQVSDGIVPPRLLRLDVLPDVPLAWRADSQEVYFSARGQVMAVGVSTEPELTTSAPRPLFDAPADLQDVSPDGEYFLFVEQVLTDD